MGRSFFKAYMTFVCVLFFAMKLHADNKHVLYTVVMDKAEALPLSYSTVKITSADMRPMYLVSDAEGQVVISLHSGMYTLEVSYVGYQSKTTHFQITDKDLKLATLYLKPDAQALSEVVITERKKLVTLNDSGLEYNLSKDVRVQSSNLLDAMRQVPLVNVDATGSLLVKGTSDYAIYLNGKPYRIAQSSPKEVFQSIPASTISKVEVITNPDARYSAEDGSTIINIITARKRIDNYSLTLNAAGETRPKGQVGATFIGTLGKLTYSLGYNYTVDHQNDQPVDRTQIFKQDDHTSQLVDMDGESDGTWQNHTIRTMFDWELDSLNSIYVDAHGLLKRIDDNTHWKETITHPNTSSQSSTFSNSGNTWLGTFETNVIYRNLYKESKSARFTVGYRYTYTPDKKDYISTDSSTRTQSRNNGGLDEHTILGDWYISINKYNDIRVGVKQICRIGDSNPSYKQWNESAQLWGESTQQLTEMDYHYNISSAYLSYSAKYRKFRFNLGTRVEYAWMDMEFPQSTSDNFSNHHFDWIPRASISYKLSEHQNMTLRYSTKLSRPSISMLSPFTLQNTNYSVSYGNPTLDNAHKQYLSLSHMYFSNKVMMSSSLDYSYTKDAILRYYNRMDDTDMVASTYDNIGQVTTVGGNLYLNYRPTPRLSLTASVNAGYYGIKNHRLGVNQDDVTYNIMFMGHLQLKRGWSIDANWGRFKQAPLPWGEYDPMDFYAMSVSKSFLKNALHVTAVANSPFSKYIEFSSKIDSPSYAQSQTNYMVGRSFGIKLAYTLHSKKKPSLKRRKTLRNDDLDTGVR